MSPTSSIWGRTCVALQAAVLTLGVTVCLCAGDLRQHLQTMFTLLRPEDTIRLVSTMHTRAGPYVQEKTIVLRFHLTDIAICDMIRYD